MENVADMQIQKRLLNLTITDPKLFERVKRGNVDLFDGNKIYSEVYSAIKQFRKENKLEVPTKDTLDTIIQEKLDRKKTPEQERVPYSDALDEVYSVSAEDVNLNKPKILDYVKRQRMFKELTLVAANDLSPESLNKFDKAYEEIKIDTSTASTSDILDVFALENKDEVAKSIEDVTGNVISTGSDFFDKLTGGGLARGELGALAAPSGAGKATALTTRIPLPNGKYKLAGDVKLGDYLLSRTGKPTKVVGVYPQPKHMLYKVTTKDGREQILHPDHLMSVWTTGQQKEKRFNPDYLMTKPLSEVMKDYKELNARKTGYVHKYSIPLTSGVEYPEQTHVISPYALGVLIAEGSLKGQKTKSGGYSLTSFTISNDDEFVMNKFVDELGLQGLEPYHYKGNYNYTWFSRDDKRVKLVVDEIKRLGLQHGTFGKFIPNEYLIDSKENRMKLLQGLIDTDGTLKANKGRDNYSFSYSTSSEKLRDTFLTLLDGLGIGRSVSADSRLEKVNYNIGVFSPDKIWSNPKYDEKLVGRKYKSNKHLATGIVNIEEFKEVESVCFTVDNPEHLFLINDYIVTHNTMSMVSLATSYLMSGKDVMYIALEELTGRMVLRIAKSVLGAINAEDKSLISDELLSKLTFSDKIEETLQTGLYHKLVAKYEEHTGKKMGKFIFTRYSPHSISLEDLRQVVSDTIVTEGRNIDILMVDYPDLLNTPGSIDNEAIVGGRTYEGVRAIAQDFDVVGWVASQVNRSASQQDTIDRNSLEGSYRKINATEFFGFIQKSNVEFENNLIRIYTDKSRNGEAGSMAYGKIGRFTKFIELEDEDEQRLHESMLNGGKSEEPEYLGNLKQYAQENNSANGEFAMRVNKKMKG
jgi:hypothetical protein